MPYYFVPPYVTYRWPLDGALSVPMDHGITVLITDGVATQKQYATHEEREAADYCYVGGRQYLLTDAEVTMLQGLGYGDEIFFLSETGDVTITADAGEATAAGGSSSFLADSVFTTVAGAGTAAGDSTSFLNTQDGLMEPDPSLEYAGALATASGGETSFFGPPGNGAFTTVASSAVAAGGLSSFTSEVDVLAIVEDYTLEATENTQSFAVPSTVEAGDIGLLCVTFNQQDVPADPSGWTLHTTLNISSSHCMQLWYRDLDGTEAGTTISWNAVGSGRWVGHLVIVRNAGAIDASATYSTTTAGTGYTIPSLTPVTSDTLHLAFQSAKWTATGTHSATPPSGWTELKDSATVTTSTTSSHQQSVLQANAIPTAGVATGNTTGGVVNTSAASRGVIALTIERSTVTPPATRKMYYGAFAVGGTPEPFENGTGTFSGIGLGGRILPAFRKYYSAADSNASITNRITDDHNDGRLPLISTKVPTNWQAMASGSQDSWLQGRINACIADQEVILMFHHEPWNDINGTTNTQATWIAMHARAKQLKDATPGAENVKITGMLNGFNLEATGSERDGWYSTPEDGAFDYYGADRYQAWETGDPVGQWTTVPEWGTCITVLKGWGWENKIVVGEWGVHDFTADPGRSEQWIYDMYDFCYDNGVYAVSYFNSATGLGEILVGDLLAAFIACIDDSRTARITD